MTFATGVGGLGGNAVLAIITAPVGTAVRVNVGTGGDASTNYNSNWNGRAGLVTTVSIGSNVLLSVAGGKGGLSGSIHTSGYDRNNYYTVNDASRVKVLSSALGGGIAGVTTSSSASGLGGGGGGAGCDFTAGTCTAGGDGGAPSGGHGAYLSHQAGTGNNGANGHMSGGDIAGGDGGGACNTHANDNSAIGGPGGTGGGGGGAGGFYRGGGKGGNGHFAYALLA